MKVKFLKKDSGLITQNSLSINPLCLTSEDYEVFHQYKHNMLYYDRIKDALKKGSVLFTHTTGAGKTYTALQVILYLERQYALDKVVVLGHNDGVVRTWRQLFNTVKSDKMSKALPLREKDAYEAEGQVQHEFTNSEGETEVLSFSYRAWTYQAALNRLEDDSFIQSNTIYILDEPHHLASEDGKWGEIIKALNNSSRSIYILGLTATSDTLSGDTSKLFDTSVKGLSLKDAQSGEYDGYEDDDPTKKIVKRQGQITSQLMVYTIPLCDRVAPNNIKRLQELRKHTNSTEESSKLQNIRNIFSRENIASLVQGILSSRGAMKIVASVDSDMLNSAKIRHLISDILGVSDSNIHTVSYNTKEEEREDIFDKFENSPEDTVIVNYDVISEGVHLGGVNGLLILRNTTSSRQYIQSIGRGISSQSNEVVPVIDLTPSIFRILRKNVGAVDDLEYLKNAPVFATLFNTTLPKEFKDALMDYISLEQKYGKYIND